jgi:penicillin V acylase-like amidase (Ntn superfamily)
MWKLLLAGAFALGAGPAQACTALKISDKQGNVYSGKTLEFAVPLPFEMIFVPAGTQTTSPAPRGKTGQSFATRYPVLGVGADPGLGSPIPMMVEAINDRGLSLSTNELDGSQSPAYPASNQANYLAASDLGLYLLGRYQTVAEVRRALESGEVRVWLPQLPVMGNARSPLHYVFFDRSGAGIVVEYLNGRQTIYDNPVGVATNAPDFGWHLKNLNNYAFLTNVDKNRGTFGNLKVQAPDAGSALASVPSAQISPGRFVKAAYYVTYARKASTPDGAVITLGHILNNFDRVKDISIDQGSGSEGSSANSVTSEVTQFTWMNDKQRNRYYLRTIDALNFASFEIDQLAPIKQLVRVPLARINDSQLDGTKILLNAVK